MDERETSRILTMLYTEVGKPLPPPKVKIWAQELGRVPFQLGMLAAREMIKKTRIYGEPQFAEYADHVRRLHKEAKAALKPRKTFDSAQLAYMSPKDRDALQARNAAPKMPREQAKAILDAVDLHMKSIPGGKTLKAKELERGSQQKMIEGLRAETEKRDVIELGPPEQERKPFLPAREPVPAKSPEEFEAERERQRELLKGLGAASTEAA